MHACVRDDDCTVLVTAAVRINWAGTACAMVLATRLECAHASIIVCIILKFSIEIVSCEESEGDKGESGSGREKSVDNFFNKKLEFSYHVTHTRDHYKHNHCFHTNKYSIGMCQGNSHPYPIHTVACCKRTTRFRNCYHRTTHHPGRSLGRRNTTLYCHLLNCNAMERHKGSNDNSPRRHKFGQAAWSCHCMRPKQYVSRKNRTIGSDQRGLCLKKC
jgi:hypothetical protein